MDESEDAWNSSRTCLIAYRTANCEYQDGTAKWTEIKVACSHGFESVQSDLLHRTIPVLGASTSRKMYISHSTLLSSDLCLMVDQNTYLLWNHGTEWLHHSAHWSVRGETTDHAGDWLNSATLCSCYCLTSANCKHRESNTWKQMMETQRCDSKLPMATTWNKYVVINQDRVNDNLWVSP